MKNFFTKLRLGFIASIMLFAASTFAQTKISGKVSDGATKESLIGVSIAVKGKVIGTITDTKGNFSLSTSTPTPFTISVSSVGYKTQEISVTDSKSDFDIKLEEQNVMGQEIVVSASRVEENVMKSPVSVEKMDLRTFQTTPAATFYDALKNLKGVDTNVQSLTFQSVTTRGFNGNGNPRVVQLVDGMDNQAPGLNFAVGNIVGISELDLENVELIPGAASALYGPNAMNGIILMNSKSPFLYQGLSANVKLGTMNADNRTTPSTGYTDFSVRYAKAFNNKFAFKLNVAYLEAQDWQASNYTNQSLRNGNTLGRGTRATDQAYDGVNIYGDEGNQGLNFQTVLRPILQDPTNPLTAGINQISAATGGLLTPTAIFNSVFPNNTVFVSRTGYEENTLADYTTKSLKLNAALHWRLNDKVEAIFQGNYGYGTSLYTGSDRYSIKNFSLWQAKAELKGADFYLRAYTTQENSGDSYANSTLASGINEAWKRSEAWYGDYVAGFAGSYGAAALGAYGTSFQTAFAAALRAGQTQVQAFTAGVTAANTAVAGISPAAYYGTARANADRGRLLPGTPEFNAAADAVKSRAIPGIVAPASARALGAKFLDRTALYHLEGMYNLSKAFNNALEVVVGANFRSYDLNSNGTIFAKDENGKEFTITEFGGYVSLAKQMFNDKFKLSGSMRFDKNQNFAGQFTPRISGVFSPTSDHNFRASYQTGFRMPTTQNQYIDLFVGSSRLLGGLPFLRERYFQGKPAYSLPAMVASGATGVTPAAINFGEYKPEKVYTWEVGYKGLLMKKLFVDAYYYQSTYQDFINGVVVTTASRAADVNAGNIFSVSSNSTVDVKTAGWGLGFDYSLPKGFTLSLNGARNEVTNQKDLPAESQQTGYSTPLYRVNASLSNRNIAGSGFGFGITWRYQESFDGPSGIASALVQAQRLANVPQFNTLDAQISKKISSIKSILKIGGNNIMGNTYFTGFGNPTVGSMFYVGLTFDELLNK
ncbi:MAG: TonB-dependent receptor [Arcicella sp.]|nr:TonB-dependent receptor [Arcicella sp.]